MHWKTRLRKATDRLDDRIDLFNALYDVECVGRVGVWMFWYKGGKVLVIYWVEHFKRSKTIFKALEQHYSRMKQLDR